MYFIISTTTKMPMVTRKGDADLMIFDRLLITLGESSEKTANMIFDRLLITLGELNEK